MKKITYFNAYQMINEKKMDKYTICNLFKIPVDDTYFKSSILKICQNDITLFEPLFKNIMSSTENTLSKCQKRTFTYKELLNYIIDTNATQADLIKVFNSKYSRAYYNEIDKILLEAGLKDQKKELLTSLRLIIKNNDTIAQQYELCIAVEEKVDLVKSKEFTLKDSQNDKYPIIVEDPEITIYTYEFLKDYMDDIEFTGDSFILFSSLSLMMENKNNDNNLYHRISHIVTKKNNIEIYKCNSLYQFTYKEYRKNICFENDIILREFHNIIKKYASKNLVVATTFIDTILNLLLNDLKVKIPISCLNNFNICSKNDHNNKYFILSSNILINDISFSIPDKNSSIAIFDTCSILHSYENNSTGNYISDSLLKYDFSLINIKIIKELMKKEPSILYLIFYYASFNEKIKIVLDTNSYFFEDTCLQFFYEKLIFNGYTNVTIISRDNQLILDCITNNIRINRDAIILNKITQNTIYNTNQSNTSIYYSSFVFKQKNSKFYVSEGDKTIETVYTRNKHIMQITNNGHIHGYIVSVNCFIKFKNDPQIYKIIKLTGKKNLISTS